MSQGNVELVREHVKAFLAKDTRRANAFLDPHVVWDGSRTAGVETGNVTYGTQQLDDFVRSYRGAFDRFDWNIHDFVELGPGVVLGLVTETGYGRQSGVPVDRSYALVYLILDRKIVRITLFPSEDEARAAVGHVGH
ncbi:MAG: nuclear transport factor 2 family protein [Actinomycetota bacterium]|nr:nuclear transport factor 2 family protein [Actinomycetota bacterium]